MKPEKNISRRDFITRTGTALTCASAGLLAAGATALNAAKATPKANIKIAMYIYTLMNAPWSREEMDIVEVCRRTRELGIDGLDFIADGYNKSWAEIRKIAEDHGLKCICYTRGIGALESPDKTVRRQGLEEFKNRLETAQILGTNRIMLNQGGVSTGNDSDTNRKWIIEGLKDALPLAKAAGIEVTLETHNNPLAPFRNSSNFSQAIAQLPDLRVCFDTGNSYVGGEDPLQGYLNNKEHVTHMHFKDFKGDSLGNAKGPPCVPGTGVIDFPSIIQAMKKNGYQGYINLEKGGPDGFEVYRKSMEIIKPLIES